MKDEIEVIAEVLEITSERAWSLFKNERIRKNGKIQDIPSYVRENDRYEVLTREEEVFYAFDISETLDVVNVRIADGLEKRHFLHLAPITPNDTIRDYAIDLALHAETWAEMMIRHGKMDAEEKYKMMFKWMQDMLEYFSKYKDWNQKIPSSRSVEIPL